MSNVNKLKLKGFQMKTGKENWIKKINSYGKQITSTGNQDGIIEYICKNISIKHKFCIGLGFNAPELRTTDGRNNAINIIIKQQWDNLLLDKKHENHSCKLYKEFITSDNICDIFKKHNVPVDPGYISINIKTTSLWITDAILDKYNPSFFSIKFNPNIPIDYAITFPNDPNERWESDKIMSASLKAIKIMAEKHNYSLVYAGKYEIDGHHDAFFIRNKLLSSLETPNIKNFKHVLYPAYLYCITGRYKIMMDYETWLETKNVKASKDKALKVSKSYLEANFIQYFKTKIYRLMLYIKGKIQNTLWLYRILKRLKSPKRFFIVPPKNDHLDARFYKKNMSQTEIKKELKRILNVFAKLSIENDIKPIIFHGSLIGYYFNKQILPWDNDIDIKLVGSSIDNMKKLDRYQTKDILIEVNPNCISRSTLDYENLMDARVISKTNGAFIDITFLTPTKDKNIIACKFAHYIHIKDLMPLKKTTFEGATVYVPNNIEKILVNNYGQNVLTPSNLDGWKFKDGKWVR